MFETAELLGWDFADDMQQWPHDSPSKLHALVFFLKQLPLYVTFNVTYPVQQS